MGQSWDCPRTVLGQQQDCPRKVVVEKTMGMILGMGQSEGKSQMKVRNKKNEQKLKNKSTDFEKINCVFEKS